MLQSANLRLHLFYTTASLPGAPSPYSGTTSYGYDTRNELMQETRTGSGTGNYSNAFSYDSAENPQVFRSQPATGSNAFSVDNQTTAFTGSSGSSLGSFGYDGNGNPTTYKGSTLAFDPENRMTGYGSALTNGYGPDDLRAWKQGANGSTYFLYSNMNQPVCEFNASGTLTATNTYGHVGLVSRRVGSTSTFYTFDPQGSVAQRLNASGGVISSDTGDAFGSRATTGTGDVFGYVSQWGYYTDAETGLCLCQHRYYDPATGRFINLDPIEYTGGINLYNYCQNNPVNAIDTSGYDPLEIIGGLLEGAAACGSLVLGDTLGRGDTNFCADMGACIGAAFVTGISIWQPSCALSFVCGCVVNAVGQLVANAATMACNCWDTCCKPLNTCQWISQVVQAAGGCLEGGLSAGLHIYGLSILQMLMDSTVDTSISLYGGSQDKKCGG